MSPQHISMLTQQSKPFTANCKPYHIMSRIFKQRGKTRQYLQDFRKNSNKSWIKNSTIFAFTNSWQKTQRLVRSNLRNVHFEHAQHIMNLATILSVKPSKIYIFPSVLFTSLKQLTSIYCWSFAIGWK